MPKSVERCVAKLTKEGKSSDSAWAICTAAHNKGKLKEDGTIEVMDLQGIIVELLKNNRNQELFQGLGEDWESIHLEGISFAEPASEAILFESEILEEAINPVAKLLKGKYNFQESVKFLNISQTRNDLYQSIEVTNSEPMYVIFELPSGYSKIMDEDTVRHPDKTPKKELRNRFWTEEVIYSFAEQIRSRKPVGYMGHADPTSFNQVPENIPVQWETAIKARRKSDNIGVTLARGYVYDHGMNRAYLKSGAINSASVFTVGKTEQDTTDKKNPFLKVTSAGLISFDFVRKDTHGIPGTRLVANITFPSKENVSMELTAEQIAVIANLTVEQLTQYNPGLVAEFSKAAPNEDYMKLAGQLKTEIIKGVELARNASIVKQCAEEMKCEPVKLLEIVTSLKKHGEALVESEIVTLTETIINKALRERVRTELREAKIMSSSEVKGKMAQILQGYRDLILEIGETLDLSSIGALITEGAKSGEDSLLDSQWQGKE